MRKCLTLKIEKNIPHKSFLQFYEPPDLGKKIFTTWNVFKSEVYLTCTNFWKLHDDLKACLEVIRLPIDQKMWNLTSKFNFLHFCHPEKSVFELMTNLKFSFSESGPGSVPIPPKPIFYLTFWTFKVTLKMLQIIFCPQIQQEKFLKMAIILNHLDYAA